MKKNALKIVSTTKQEEKKRKQLLTVIQRKRLILKDAVIKTEMLKVNVEMARQEYMAKVGNLFLKDNQLDLEIIKLKNILKLLNEGYTFEEAEERIANTYYAEQIEIEKEQQRAKEEEEIFLKREEAKKKPTDDIRNIWKRLIAKFHPDLVQEKQEKKKRDKIMKQINKAYQEGDLDNLVAIEQNHMNDKETTIENLEEILVSVINSIEQQKESYKELKQSEWYDWMIKIERAKRHNENIFAETERKLLDDIVAKIEVLKELRKNIKARSPEAPYL